MNRRKKLSIFVILTFAFLFCFIYQPFERPAGAIVIYGDTRTNHKRHQEIVDAIMKKKPVTVFHTGDLVENGLNPEHWQKFNEITGGLIQRAQFYPVLGNHEYNSKLYFENFQLPNNERWYSLEQGNVHFVLLDSNAACDVNSEQYAWLESDLENICDEVEFIIAVFHHPPFSCHHRDEKNLKNSIVPLLESRGVDIIFNGHTHAYERTLHNDTYYITTGGGGAPLHEQSRENPYNQKYIKKYHFCLLRIYRNRLEVQVLDRNLETIDRFSVKRH